MNGAEFRAAQQQDTALSTIPVAVISAHASTAELERFDADAFLRKPVNYDRLVELVSYYCHL